MAHHEGHEGHAEEGQKRLQASLEKQLAVQHQQREARGAQDGPREGQQALGEPTGARREQPANEHAEKQGDEEGLRDETGQGEGVDTRIPAERGREQLYPERDRDDREQEDVTTRLKT